MAGNRRAYEAAIKRAANYAWDKKWSRAIEAYERALSEFPDDVTALTGLGLAYAETRQLERALEVYRKAANVSPDNPEVLQRVGHMLERLAQWPDAARAYVAAADACLKVRDAAQAIDLWKKAAVLDPQNVEARTQLARAYQERGQPHQAARQHLILARVEHRKGRHAQALAHCKAALELAPRNAEARGMLEAIQQRKPLPDGPTARLQPGADGKRTLDSFAVFEDIEVGQAMMRDDARQVSPANLVRERTLKQLAEAAFADDLDAAQLQAALTLARAVDFHSRGVMDRAIEAYVDAIRAGSDTPAARFNLGLLYCETRDYPRAIENLSRALGSPDLDPGVHYALAECYYAWGKMTDALQHLLQVLKMIDAQAASEERASEIDDAYDQFARGLGPTEAQQLIKTVFAFLSSPGWGRKALEMRRQMERLTGGAILITLAETMAEPRAQIAADAMARIQRYMEQGLLPTALEECFWAIQQVPYYLPLHLRLADILIAKGHIEEAVLKYTTIAETYRVRGQVQRAVAIYRRALDLSPMAVDIRERLIQVLLGARMYNQAIEQYMSVADAYYQLAQVNRAIEKYSEALRYVPRAEQARDWEVSVLHRIGDIYMQRLNWKQAIRAYERVRRVDPENEKARTYLVDLYFKTGQRERAIQELDELIAFYRDSQRDTQGLAALREFAQSRPDEPALHIRLARLYLNLDRREEAIAELDTVGELQLNAGMTQEAIQTVQAIIHLGPANVEGYRQLLRQLRNQ